MKDICEGPIKIQYACEAGRMSRNGTLLMVTDLTVMNEGVNLSQPLPMNYIYTAATIVNSHFKLHQSLWGLMYRNFD